MCLCCYQRQNRATEIVWQQVIALKCRINGRLGFLGFSLRIRTIDWFHLAITHKLKLRATATECFLSNVFLTVDKHITIKMECTISKTAKSYPWEGGGRFFVYSTINEIKLILYMFSCGTYYSKNYYLFTLLCTEVFVMLPPSTPHVRSSYSGDCWSEGWARGISCS